MAETFVGSGKYSLEKVMGEIPQLKATQKRYAKQHFDTKLTITADKISFVSDNTKTTADSANLEILDQQLKKIEKIINRLETCGGDCSTS